MGTSTVDVGGSAANSGQQAPPAPKATTQTTAKQVAAGMDDQSTVQMTASRHKEGSDSQPLPSQPKTHIDMGAHFIAGCPSNMPGEQLVQKLKECVQALTGIKSHDLVCRVAVHPKKYSHTPQRMRLEVDPFTHGVIYSQHTELPHHQKGDGDFFLLVHISLAVTSAGITYRKAHQGVYKHLQKKQRSPSWQGTHLMAETTPRSGKWEQVNIEFVLKDMREQSGRGDESTN